MFYFAVASLALLTLLGLLGIFVTIAYPRGDIRSMAGTLEQTRFQRSFFTVAICSGALVAVLTQMFSPGETLIVALASLIVKEYAIFVLKGRSEPQ